ncbi:type I methionyl aminopeptidase, partial [Bacillus velezensis]
AGEGTGVKGGGRRCDQVEHTIAITETGFDILTKV